VRLEARLSVEALQRLARQVGRQPLANFRAELLLAPGVFESHAIGLANARFAGGALLHGQVLPGIVGPGDLRVIVRKDYFMR